MKVTDVCQSYFSGFHEVSSFKKNSSKINALALLKILSYFTVVIPLIFATVYGAASLYGRVTKKSQLTSQDQLVNDRAHRVLDNANQGNSLNTDKETKAQPAPAPTQEPATTKFDYAKARAEMIAQLDKTIEEQNKLMLPAMKKSYETICADKDAYEKAKTEIEEGINVSAELIQKIRDVIPIVWDFNDHTNKDLIRHNSRSHVFSFRSDRKLIFKATALNARESKQIKERFDNIVKCHLFIKLHRLSSLVIPHAKLIEVDGITLLAEEYISHKGSFSDQEAFFERCQGLTSTIRHMATFIAGTGFWDVRSANVVILNGEQPEDEGVRKICLLDLEHLNDPLLGLSGDSGTTTGLMGMVFHDEQMDTILTEANRWCLKTDTVAATKERRLKELEKKRRLHKFYEERGILAPGNAAKEIEVKDLTTLGLNLEEKEKYQVEKCLKSEKVDDFCKKFKDSSEYKVGKRRKEGTCVYYNESITLEQFAKQIIGLINKEIRGGSKYTGDDIYLRRRILIHINMFKSPYSLYNLGGDIIYDNTNWIRRIVDSLIKKGCLFGIIRTDGHGCLVQA